MSKAFLSLPKKLTADVRGAYWRECFEAGDAVLTWAHCRAGQATALAAGMRDFTDHILASLRSKAPGATVTEQDVRSMLSDFRRRAA